MAIPVEPPRKPALLGLTAYLLTGLTLGITYLLGHTVLGAHRLSNAVGGDLPPAIQDGQALTVTLFAFLILAPVLALGIAALMGRHAGRTGQPGAGAAAITTLIGVPLLWVNLAIAALLSGAILSAWDVTDAFDTAVDSLAGSLVQLLVVLGPLVALAALVAHRAQGWAIHTEATLGDIRFPVDEQEGGPYGGELATDPDAWIDESEGEGIYPQGLPEDQRPPEDEFPGDPHMVTDLQVDCPRCGRGFTVSGHRPLRITCPDCGKTGTIE